MDISYTSPTEKLLNKNARRDGESRGEQLERGSG